MTLSWVPARVDGFGVFVVMAGTSTTGKTFTLLRMATGIARCAGGDIAVLDTEGGRTHHYADRFRFRVMDMQPPYHPDRFAEAAIDAEKQGFACLLIDNFSLEWNGAGGVLSMQEAELARLVERDKRNMSDDVKRFKHGQQSWIKPKQPHKQMMQTLLQRRMPILFAIRAEDKTKPAEDGEKPVKLGWVPTQDPRFMYEWTVSWTLSPETPGKPRRDLRHKCEGQHDGLFPDGEYIGEAAGEGLWRWANSAAAHSPRGAATLPAAEGGGHPSVSGAAATVAGPDATGTPDAASSSPAPTVAAAAADIFPGDLPAGETLSSASRKAVDFADELIGEIRKQRVAAHVKALLANKKVLARLDRLAQHHPAQHQRVLAAATEWSRELMAHAA